MIQWQPTSLSVNPRLIVQSVLVSPICLLRMVFRCQNDIYFVVVYDTILNDQLVTATRLAFDLGQKNGQFWVTTLAFDG